MATSSNWIDAFVVRFGDRLGKGLRTAPRDALIADSVQESRAGRAFGLHRTIDQIGAILGPVATFALLQYIDIRAIFLLSLIPGAITLLILVFFVKEVALKRSTTSTRTSMLSNIHHVIKDNRPFVLLLIITALIFGIGAFNFSFILLRASDFRNCRCSDPFGLCHN